MKATTAPTKKKTTNSHFTLTAKFLLLTECYKTQIFAWNGINILYKHEISYHKQVYVCTVHGKHVHDIFA